MRSAMHSLCLRFNYIWEGKTIWEIPPNNLHYAYFAYAENLTENAIFRHVYWNFTKSAILIYSQNIICALTTL